MVYFFSLIIVRVVFFLFFFILDEVPVYNPSSLYFCIFIEIILEGILAVLQIFLTFSCSSVNMESPRVPHRKKN